MPRQLRFHAFRTLIVSWWGIHKMTQAASCASASLCETPLLIRRTVLPSFQPRRCSWFASRAQPLRADGKMCSSYELSTPIRLSSGTPAPSTSSSHPVDMAGKRATLLTNATELIDSVDTFIFDCDGVLWSSNKVLPGVKKTLDLLRSLGKRLYFLTNNSTKSRSDCVKKAHSLGLNLKEEEMFSSGFAVVLYLKLINFSTDKKVYLISESGLVEEFDQAGVSYINGADHDAKQVNFSPEQFLEHDHDVGAVVVGFDRNINYYKMLYASLCLRENPDCLFIATNCDETIMPTDCQGWPGESAMVGAIQGVTKKKPVVLGKPSTFMLEYICERFQIRTEQICMVGDNLETDILFGKHGGCKTLLVLTGVTDLEYLQSPENDIQPDYFVHKLDDLVSYLESSSVFQ